MSRNGWWILMVVGGVAGLCATANADFTMAALPDLNTDIRTYTDGSTYNPLFPGVHTWNGVPFTRAVDGQGHTAWTKAGGTTAQSLDIPVNVFGVATAYTIINTAYGSLGTTDGSVEFLGSGGSTYSVPLIQGTNIRDHFDGSYVNTIDGVTAVPAFNVGPGHARLDMQIYTLPGSFLDESLTTIRFTSGAPSASGIPFIVAATVATSGTPNNGVSV